MDKSLDKSIDKSLDKSLFDKSLFEYEDYKSYLLDWIKNKKRGEKSRIAQALHCHIAYVSQVLHGNGHFSLEQAKALSTYLRQTEEESDFFLLLVSYARAGTRALEDHYRKKINHILHERTILQKRLLFKKKLSPENQSVYYSAWYYSAVHLLLSIPEYQTQEKVASHLGLPLDQVAKIIEFLETIGLITQSQGQYHAGEVSIHLGTDSPMLTQHHINWRLKAIQSLDHVVPENLHYSSIISIAHKDAPEVRKLLLQTIEKIRALVRSSPEEKLYCYCIDFFNI